MTATPKIALAQINFCVGDIEANSKKIKDYAKLARDEMGADLVIFPELAVTGYPPEDLLLRPGFLESARKAVYRLAATVQGIDIVLGMPFEDNGGLRNAAVVLRGGKTLCRYSKQRLPNYRVFDEKRYFQAGNEAVVFACKGLNIGLTVCEDIWHPQPALLAKQAGADVIININASPYSLDKHKDRIRVLQQRVAETGLPIIYLNCVGGQDELVFDGGTMIMGATQQLLLTTERFAETLIDVSWPPQTQPGTAINTATDNTNELADIYKALVTGVHDYVRKNGFPGVLLGLSGGIDSAMTLAIAVDALGAKNVNAVMMPSRYTAQMSLDDASEQATTQGVEYAEVSIEPIYEQFVKTLEPLFVGTKTDTTEENIQARSRGVVLMALSNKTGRMLLTTGNKSEMAVGYATLYGDMAGGFAPLKDVSKTLVYELARYRNTLDPVIPERVITREPSAELSADQKDSDSLPPYDILDPILERFIEHDQSVEEIAAAGFDAELVKRVATMVLRNEYKRRQAPPGVRITSRGFGKDRRYPITSGYVKKFVTTQLTP